MQLEEEEEEVRKDCYSMLLKGLFNETKKKLSIKIMPTLECPRELPMVIGMNSENLTERRKSIYRK